MPDAARLDPLPDPRPTRRPAPPDGTFEIALVLAGAVSAGAYTAGVLDFLFEALEAWYARKAAGTPDTPPHDVVIRVITGSSAGAITGAIAAAALGYRYPHVRASTAPAQAPDNPFYNAWVKQIDIADLLGKTDLSDGNTSARSLLDSTKLQQIADQAIGYTHPETIRRPYIADPLRLILTVTNLRGVPYSLDLQGNAAARHEMMSHADCMRFSVRGIGTLPLEPVWPDEIALGYPKASDDRAGRANWSLLGTAALASGAFPLGLLPRALSRPADDYRYRRVAAPGDEGQIAMPIVPSWGPSMPARYEFLCVDGGAMDNEPLELARQELAGLLGRNPREGNRAHRAVILVDPFPDAAVMGPQGSAPAELFGLGLAMASAWKDQARFKPVDLALASQDTVYSRFMVTPARGGNDELGRQGIALAGGALGGFSGFLAEPYRHHDYLLGRRNCQQFLRCHFTLPADNPLFNAWPHSLRDKYLSDASPQRCAAGRPEELPIVPLLSECAAAEPLPPWPIDVIDLDKLETGVQRRLDTVYGSITLGALGRGLLALGWSFFLRGKLTRLAMSKIEAALLERKLLSKPRKPAPKPVDRLGRA
jgi:hypothetical protein